MKNLKNLLTLIVIIILPNFSKLNSYNPVDINKLLSGEINLAEADFSEADLSGANLKNRNFAGANFEGAILNGTKFNDSNLNRANLSHAQAVGACFLGCVMHKTNCSNAIFKKAIFGNRKIHNWHCADMRKATLLNTSFDRANLDKVDLRGVLVNRYTNFSNSSMFLVNVNREIFDIVKYKNTFLIEKPSDDILEGLVTDLEQLKLKRLRKIKPIKPTSDPEKLFIKQECPICLENFINDKTIAVLPCGHIFHVECIQECFLRKYECPLCRFRTNWYKQAELNN